MTEFLVKFFGVLAGVVARSLLPWLRKLRDGEVQGFDRRYLISAIASFLICFIISLLLFPQFAPPPALSHASAVDSAPAANPSSPATTTAFEAYFKLFCLAFGFGFGFDGLIKEAGQWVRVYHKAKKSDK